jgi:hypothetical protein
MRRVWGFFGAAVAEFLTEAFRSSSVERTLVETFGRFMMFQLQRIRNRRFGTRMV